MGCDLCGRKEKLFRVLIEGSVMSVCCECSKFGNVLESVEPRKEEKKPVVKEEVVEIITRNYSRLIKEARENLNLKQEELAKKISEKTSMIHKLESGGMEPSLELAKKLERFLNIRLIEEYK